MHYAEKELLVFKAFRNILLSDYNLTKITVADIAKEAGIGKGTVYEYFSSKEEIIAKSMIYNIYEITNNLRSKIDSDLTFKQNCYILIDSLTDKVLSLSPYSKLFSSNLNLDNFKEHLKGDFVLLNELRNDMNFISNKIISIGIDEGIINKNDDLEYQKFVIRCACTGVVNSICNNCNITPEDIENYKAYTYKYICKALQ